MQQDSNYDQIMTRYPFSRQAISKMFKNPVDVKNQKLFNATQSIKQIQKQIIKLTNLYQDLNLQVQKGIINSDNHKKMNKKVFGSFRCNQCNNKFTSILGNYQVQFKKLPNNYFIYTSKIYRLQCKRCLRQCQGKIFESQLQAVAKSFCLIIASILEDLPKPERKIDDRFKLRNVHWHKQQLCEACKKGRCFNIPNTQNDVFQKARLHNTKRDSNYKIFQENNFKNQEKIKSKTEDYRNQTQHNLRKNKQYLTNQFEKLYQLEKQTQIKNENLTTLNKQFKTSRQEHVIQPQVQGIFSKIFGFVKSFF